MPNLANRVSVHICRDLSLRAPKTLHALENWLDQCGFWLEELTSHASTKDQVPFMIRFLGLALCREIGMPKEDCCELLQDHLTMHLIAKELLS